MGWLKWSGKETSIVTVVAEDSDLNYSQRNQLNGSIDQTVRLVSQLAIDTPYSREHYPLQPVTRADAQLPFIPKEIVQASKQECLWLVIDNIVYDCSGFEHPGGATVIQSFRGEDCSWQFWRFHSKTHMQEFGRPLRIGRTAGVPNRFKERPKFVGLSKLGGNDW